LDSGLNSVTDKEVLVELEKATFAGGCFWSVEGDFRMIEGVTRTTVGYTGGTTKNPTYEEVCTDTTGHAEALQIEFDPNAVSYKDLLDVFWRVHDPTTMNRQGPDVGTQYRSAIFVHSSEQEATATASLLEAQKRYDRPIVTEVTPASEFYPAEDYHQRYYEKRGMASCTVRLKESLPVWERAESKPSI
jgi:peptide-methionine (S)-S-oxide reductase